MAICVLTGLLTPLGDTPYTYLYKTMKGNTTKSISEHLPLTLINNKEMLVVLTATLALLIFTDTKIRLKDLFMFAGLTLLMFMTRRQESMLVLLGSAVLATLITQLFMKYDSKGLKEFEDIAVSSLGTIAVVLLIVLLSVIEIKPKLDENIESSYKKYENMIENGESAYKFYDEANKFTQSVKNVLANLTNKDAQDFIINSNGETIQTTVFSDETEYKIFDFNSDSSKPEKNIECRSSNFNQHRLAVIKNKIRTNLAIAITNFNSAYNIEFQMPELTEEDWAKAMNNISLISFIQGIDIGGKTYNGYTIINNSESKEVVREENIYILGNDGFYHRIGDKYLLEANNIGGNSEYNSNVNASGRLNLDFNKQRAYTEDGSTVYYYPISKYYASYNSIVNQNYWDKDYDNYNDIYAYVATKNVNLRKAFYMALGRERYGMYKSN